jgi:hypothetical protein
MNQKTLLLVALAITSFLCGAVRQYFTPGVAQAPSDIAFVLTGTLVVFLWYRIDSNIRNYQRSALLNVGVIALTIIVLPYYFFRSRGAKGGFLALGWFLAFLVVSYALDLAGGHATYYALQS